MSYVHVCIRICTFLYSVFYIVHYICALLSPCTCDYTDGSLVADCGFTDNIVQGPVCVCVCVCVCVLYLCSPLPLHV